LNKETFMRARDHLVLWAFATAALVLAACQSIAPSTSPTGDAIRDLGGNVQLTSRLFNAYTDAVELADMSLRGTAENVIVINTEQRALNRDTITLTGNVLLALNGSDLEADEITIRTLDGHPINLSPTGQVELDGREFELTSPRARVTSAYRESGRGEDADPP